MIKGLPHPTTTKLNHKPTAAASRTVQVPSHFTSPNHVLCKLKDTRCAAERGNGTTVMTTVTCESYTLVVTMHLLSSFTMLHVTAVAMKNRNKAHFTVVYIFVSFFVIVC